MRKKKEINKSRHCNYMMILYDEMSVFDKPYKYEDGNIIEDREVVKVITIHEVIERIKSYCFLKDGHYYYIRHDKDYLENGTLEEPHYHVIVSFSKGEYEQDITNLIYTPLSGEYFSPKIQHCAIKDSVLYLTHRSVSSKKDNTKYKYPLSEIVTDNPDYVEKVYSGVSEEIDLTTLYNYIDSLNYYIRLQHIIKFALDNNLYGSLRRSQYLVLRYIQEHNEIELRKEEFRKSIKSID